MQYCLRSVMLVDFSIAIPLRFSKLSSFQIYTDALTKDFSMYKNCILHLFNSLCFQRIVLIGMPYWSLSILLHWDDWDVYEGVGLGAGRRRMLDLGVLKSWWGSGIQIQKVNGRRWDATWGWGWIDVRWSELKVEERMDGRSLGLKGVSWSCPLAEGQAGSLSCIGSLGWQNGNCKEITIAVVLGCG